MADSIKQLIEDMNTSGSHHFAQRLEALIGEPVAYMNPKPISSWDTFCTKNVKKVWPQAKSGHTIPLYQIEQVKK